MNTSNITRFSANLAENNVVPDNIWNLSVPTVAKQILGGDPYDLGCRFHRLLRRIADHGRLNQSEKQLLPWLECLRDELRRHGVAYLEPEVRLNGNYEVRSGACDMLMRGGLAPCGVAEVKVIAHIPSSPLAHHLLQLTRYAELVTRNLFETDVWGALVYVNIAERRIRIFVYADCARLRDCACHLLAA